MAEEVFDFAVLGSTPLALLLAGLLAGAHNRRVCLVAETQSPFRLPRGLDLSVGPVTRPDTWALLKRTTPELKRLLASIGAKRALERVDPVFTADGAEGAEVLAHMRMMLVAHGFGVERIADVRPPGAACRVRDVLMLNRQQLLAPAGKWLDKLKVYRMPADNAAVTIRRDGGGRIERGGEVVEAKLVIAADDNAILDHVEGSERARLLTSDLATSVLTEPTKALPVRLAINVDRGVLLAQRGGGTISAIATGGGTETLARIGASLSGRVRRAGQATFRTLVPTDGAPLVGHVRGLRAAIVAGFGPCGAFLAPALARYFAEAASEDERKFFVAREGGRDVHRAAAADYAGLLALGSAS